MSSEGHDQTEGLGEAALDVDDALHTRSEPGLGEHHQTLSLAFLSSRGQLLVIELTKMSYFSFSKYWVQFMSKLENSSLL